MSVTVEDIKNLQDQIIGTGNNLQLNQNFLQEQIIKNSSVQKLTEEQKKLLVDIKYNDTIALLTTDVIQDIEDVNIVIIDKSNFKVGETDNVYDYVTNTKLYNVGLTLENIVELLEHNIKNIQISGLFLRYNVETNVLEEIFLDSKLIYNNYVDSQTLKYKKDYHIDKDTIMSVIVDEKLKKFEAQYNELGRELKNYMIIGLNNTILKLENVTNKKNLLNDIKLPELDNNKIHFSNYLQDFEPGFLPVNTTGNYNIAKGTKGGVVIGGSGATISKNILANGGNAVDALVAGCFAASISTDTWGYLGGAGFITYYRKSDGKSFCIDCRETLSENYPENLEWPGEKAFSTISTGVNGFLAGLYLLFKDYGSNKFTWEELIQPAIDLAELNLKYSIRDLKILFTNGLLKLVDDKLVSIDSNKYVNQFYSRDGKFDDITFTKNFRIDVSKKIELFKNIQKYGPDYMYKSKEKLGLENDTFADKFIKTLYNQTFIKKYDMNEETNQRPYLLTLNDLEKYEAKYRTPSHTYFILNNDEYEIIAHPSPCSAICTAFIVKLVFTSNAIIENNMQHPGTLYRFAMICNLGWVHRGFIAGDYDNLLNTDVLNTYQTKMKEIYNLDFDTSNIKTHDEYYSFITSDETINKFSEFLNKQPDWINALNLQVSNVSSKSVSNKIEEDYTHTNNIVISDDDVNISFNNSINYIGGNKFTVDGIFINNEVYDFPDIGTQGINNPGPSRRPASSQSPVIVLKNNDPIIICGGAGGWRIYMHCAWKIICLLNELIINNNTEINVGKVGKYIPCYGSFNFIATNNLLPTSIKEAILSNNTNEYFGGDFNTDLADTSLLYIDNNVFYAGIDPITYNLGNFNYRCSKQEVVQKLE